MGSPMFEGKRGEDEDDEEFDLINRGSDEDKGSIKDERGSDVDERGSDVDER